MIEFSDFSFQYPNNPSPVLEEISLKIPPESLSLVTGASGSGKSTFLRCINGLVPHFSGGIVSGKINVFGCNPIVSGPAEMANIVGYVFQDPKSQFVFDVVEDEIVFILENQALSRQIMKNRIDDICHKLGLENIRKNKIKNLSGGEKQLVAIASALVGLPRVLVLDEPTSQLDAGTADEVLNTIIRLKNEFDLTVLIAEQRLERLIQYTDHLINLQIQGNLQAGRPQDVLQKMSLVPPLIEIARKLKIDPLPMHGKDFPDVPFSQKAKEINLPPLSKPEIPRLEINNINVSIGKNHILTEINLDLYQGETLIIMGPTGSGKTTLIRAALGLIKSSGEILYFGKPLGERKTDQIIRQVAYLPQNPNDLLFAESVMDELVITLKNHHKSFDSEELFKFLSLLNLSDKHNMYPRDLSVGEKQRTALAAITVHEPPMIFLDEPTRGLDYVNKILLADLLSTWKNEGRSILIATHDIEFAAQIADRVAILENRKIIFCGSPGKAFTKFPSYQTQTARLFPSTQWIVPDDVAINNQ